MNQLTVHIHLLAVQQSAQTGVHSNSERLAPSLAGFRCHSNTPQTLVCAPAKDIATRTFVRMCVNVCVHIHLYLGSGTSRLGGI